MSKPAASANPQDCSRCGQPNAQGAQQCERCGAPVAPSEGSGPARPHLRPRRFGLLTVRGTVTTQPQPGRHRPLSAAAAALATATLAVCALDKPLSLNVSAPGTVDALIATALTLAAALLASLLTPLLALVSSLLPVVLVPLLMLLGIRMVLVPLLGPPGLRRRGGLLGLFPFGGIVSGLLGLVLRGVVVLARTLLHLMRVLVKEVAAPRPSVSFSVVEADGTRRHVRLLQDAAGLTNRDEVEMQGLLLGGVLHASSVRVMATDVNLRPRTGAATPLTSLLVVLAVLALLSTATP